MGNVCAEQCIGSCLADVAPRRRCATPFGIDVVGITELIALVGALVGGIAARQRKLEAERLNEQLRKINMQLRQQARAGTIYAPGLSYAPAASTMSAPTTSDGDSAAQGQTQTLIKPQTSLDEEMSPEQQRCRETMREGKRLLRNGQGADRICFAGNRSPRPCKNRELLAIGWQPSSHPREVNWTTAD